VRRVRKATDLSIGGGRAIESGEAVEEQPYNLYRLLAITKQCTDLWRRLVLVLAGTLVIFLFSLMLACPMAQAKANGSTSEPASSNKGAVESGDKGTGQPNKDNNASGNNGSLEDNGSRGYKGGDGSGSSDDYEPSKSPVREASGPDPNPFPSSYPDRPSDPGPAGRSRRPGARSPTAR
jgi:hypothetical protein